MSQTHWPSVWQLGLGLLAIVCLLGIAAIVVILGLIQIFGPTQDLFQGTSLMLVASGLALSGLLIVPSAGYAFARLIDRPLALPSWLQLDRFRWMIFILPFVILLGNWVTTRSAHAWLFLPPIHLLALGIPVLWFLWVGVRDLNMGSPQRAWGIFSTGLIVGPIMILVAEALAGGLVVATTAALLSTRPELMQEVLALAEEIRSSAQDPQRTLAILEPYLKDPRVVIAIFAFVAGIVPVIEEGIKPIGVWLLPRGGLTAADGFTAGLLSGAGFTLFENLSFVSQTEGWAFAVSGRAVTSLIHIVTAGIMGWALVSAWRRKRYIRLLLSFGLAVLIHALWNGLTLLVASSLIDASTSSPSVALAYPQVLIPIGNGVLALASLSLLFGANRALATEQAEGTT